MRYLFILLAFLTCAAAQEPGQLLDQEEFRSLSPEEVDAEVQGRFLNDGESPPFAVTGVSIHLISFSSTSQDGGPATGVAQLYLPDQPTDAALLAFAPGSTGLIGSCGPMQELLDSGFGGTYGATALAYAGQGIPTVLPDYLGTLGPDNMQPYFVATAEAALLLDALRAGNTALQNLDPDAEVRLNFMAGFSQGGHAAFAAADRAAAYTPDLALGGVIGFGPSGELDVLFRNFQYTAPWVVWAYMNAYPAAGLDAGDVLLPEYANRLEEDVRRHCVAQAQGSYPVVTESLYTEEFHAALFEDTLEEDFPEWAELFAANDTGLSPDGLPVIILQGVDDPIAPLEDQTAFVQRLCSLDTPVRYANYLRTRHETRYIGFEPSIDWMRSLLAGNPAEDDCLEVLQ